MWPSMVTHTQNLCSAFNPSKCTYTWSSWGFGALLKGSHLSRGIKSGESAGYSLPPPKIPAGLETRTHNLRVTSPTLYPLGHDCPSAQTQKKTVFYHLIFSHRQQPFLNMRSFLFLWTSQDDARFTPQAQGRQA